MPVSFIKHAQPIRRIAAIALAWMLHIFPAHGQQALHELSSIHCTPADDRISLSMAFLPDAPEEFLVYTIVQQGSPVLVAEFINAHWLGKLYTEIIRPVTHIQMMRDTLGARSLVRLFFYLEKNIPYQYRWDGAIFTIELFWSADKTQKAAAAHIAGIEIGRSDDELVTMQFTLGQRPVNYALNILADRKNAVLTFHNTRIDSALILPELPGLITDVKFDEIVSSDNIPTAKIVLQTAVKMVCNDSTINTGLIVTLRPEQDIVPVQAQAQKPDGQPADTAQQERRVLATRTHRKWTYIGIGSGVVLGGAILAAILSGKEDEGREGTGPNGEIPPIEDVITLPEQ